MQLRYRAALRLVALLKKAAAYLDAVQQELVFFRDGRIHEQADFPREVVEACLAHAMGDAAELAYKRTDFLEKRREVMTAWARYCSQ
jgi:hypothetical protein